MLWKEARYQANRKSAVALVGGLVVVQSLQWENGRLLLAAERTLLMVWLVFHPAQVEYWMADVKLWQWQL